MTIEATRWFRNGDHAVVEHFYCREVSGSRKCLRCGKVLDLHGWIDTSEGGHRVCPGDWIVTEPQGESKPCKPDIFEQTYEPVPEGLQFDTPQFDYMPGEA